MRVGSGGQLVVLGKLDVAEDVEKEDGIPSGAVVNGGGLGEA